jgi:hypothetical protein
MKFEGPLPEEALPVGEVPLTLEEVDKVSTVTFELIDLISSKFPDRINLSELTLEEQEFFRKSRVFARLKIVDSIKALYVESNESEN